MATNETRSSQHLEPANPLGTPHQRDRVALWFRGRLVLHFPAMAVLGQPSHRFHPSCLRYSP